MSTIGQRLTLLRAKMVKNNIDVYIVPTIDAHNSEYVPVIYQRRAWISGFDGSNGEAVITQDKAYLWTDGRYFLQAEQQLDSTLFTLMKQDGSSLQIEQWLANEYASLYIGIDPQLISIKRAEQLSTTLSAARSELIFLENNLVDECRYTLKELGKNKSVASNSITQTEATTPSVYSLDIQYTGQSSQDKLVALRQTLNIAKANFIALNALDEIAWLFNLRGSDIDYNPLVISYVIVGMHNVWFFVDAEKIAEDMVNQFKQENISICPYNRFLEQLSILDGVVLLDEKTANYAMHKSASTNAKLMYMKSPLVLAKACKNSNELKGAQTAHIKDAVAVINFLHWLEKTYHTNNVTEISAAEQLLDFRKQQANFKSASFKTISGFAENGAIIHYSPDETTNKTIDDSSLYLLDSGGQYLEGTTDITRTIHLGEPTVQQRHHYTLVLRGHLALARAVFPRGTCGEHLDVLARTPLWQEQLNYRHGTGHGVGSFLCVHEGPQRIATINSDVPLLPGMIVSNEPGLYIEQQYGIRIENLCYVSPVSLVKTTEYGDFYILRTLTLVPYCKKLIIFDELSNEDKRQLSYYYEEIKRLVRPLLDDETQAWLDNELLLEYT